MRNKGQALVEFVIILPIFIFLLFAIIDIGKMLYLKNQLEGEMNTIVEAYQLSKSRDSLDEILKKNQKDAVLEIQEDSTYLTFVIQEEMDLITPGLNLIFKTPYFVSVERSIPYES